MIGSFEPLPDERFMSEEERTERQRQETEIKALKWIGMPIYLLANAMIELSYCREGDDYEKVAQGLDDSQKEWVIRRAEGTHYFDSTELKWKPKR